MDKTFLKHHLPVGLDIWFRDHENEAGIYMTINERKNAIASLTEFLIPHLVNNHEVILRLHQERIAEYYDRNE